MAQPTPYARSYSFAGFQGSSPSTPLPAGQVDSELDAVADTLDQTLANLALIQRDDGLLANQSVHPAAVRTDVWLMTNGWNPRGDWAVITAYAFKDVVLRNDTVYVCLEAHESTADFDFDLLQAKWMPFTVDVGALTDAALAALFDVVPDPSGATGQDYIRVNAGMTAYEFRTLAQTISDIGLDALAFLATVGTTEMDNDAVTYAKMQNVSAASRLLGRGSAAGSGDPEELTAGTGLSVSGTTVAVDQTFTPTWTGVHTHQAAVAMSGAAINEAHGADIASASTIDLDTATGNVVDVTGTTTITAITLSEGHERTVRFTGALTLTNGASLVLLSGANITTAAGDYAIFRGYASGVVRMVAYSRANGTALVSSDPTTFVSSAQTITGAGSLTLAHSLGSQPNKFWLILSCQTGELGYSAGDEVFISPDNVDEGGSNYGCSVVPDATNLNIRYGTNGGGGNCFRIRRKDTGATGNIVNGNWKAIFVAMV